MKTPKIQPISKEEYEETMKRLEETMKRLMDIQIAADAAAKSINNLKALIATTF